MITIEEARKKLLNDCKIVTSCSWSEDRKKFDVQHWNLSVIKTMGLINELYDSFEAQLSSNTLQLTCETCKHNNHLASETDPCNSCMRRMLYVGYCNDSFEPKE